MQLSLRGFQMLSVDGPFLFDCNNAPPNLLNNTDDLITCDSHRKFCGCVPHISHPALPSRAQIQQAHVYTCMINIKHKPLCFLWYPLVNPRLGSSSIKIIKISDFQASLTTT